MRTQRAQRRDGLAPAPRHRVFDLFGIGDKRRAGLFLFGLAFFPPSLAAIGAAIAYQLAPGPWVCALGLGAGAALGCAFVRDFLDWRMRGATGIAGALFLGFYAYAFF